MADTIRYDVGAFLRTHGSFTNEMSTAARAGDTFGRSFESMSSKLVSAGQRVRGTFAELASSVASSAAMLGGGLVVGGLAQLAQQGIAFNDSMEQGALGLGTMYQTFGVAANSAKVLNGEMTQFAKSLELAEAMQGELYDIAKDSPATYAKVADAYTAMAPGVSAVTKDLRRQRDLMERISVLGFTTGGDFNQLGADVGRVVQGLAGADVRVFKTLEPVIKEAFKAYTGKDAAQDFAQQFNKLDPAARLGVFEQALTKVPNEVNEAFGKSFGGMASTIMSDLQGIAGSFGRPLMDSMKKAMARVAGEDSPLKRLDVVAEFAGQQLAKAADKLFAKLEAGADYVAKNWMMIATKIQQAGVLAGAALKAAAVVATSRMVAGYGMIAAGKIGGAAKGVQAAGSAVMGYGRKKVRGVHMAMGRGMAGKGGGSTLGKMMGKVMGGLDKTGLFRHLDVAMLKFATMGTVIAASGAALGALGLAFAGVTVVIGGFAAFMTSNWDRITSSIRQGLIDGTITLVPLITSLYTFYERLRLVGEAIFGAISPAGVMAGTLDILTATVDGAAWMLGGMIKMAALGIEVFGAFKLVTAAFFQLIADGMRMMAKIPGMGDKFDGSIASIEKLGQSIASSSDQTMNKAAQFRKAAEAIGNAQLNPMQLAAAKKKANDLEKALSDMVSGKDKKKGGRAARPSTKIDVVNLNLDMRDRDPDRILAGVLPALNKLSDKRVQAYDALEQGQA